MSLVRATSKLYLEEFPEKIRPRSLVTRDPKAIERFVAKVGHSVVKPLYGAKGRNVFMIEDKHEVNLAQIRKRYSWTATRSFKSSSTAPKTATPDLPAQGTDPRARRATGRLPASAYE